MVEAVEASKGLRKASGKGGGMYMKVLASAVTFVLMLAVAGCGKKAEVAAVDPVESVREEREEPEESADADVEEPEESAVHITAKTENISRCMTRMKIICFFLTRRATTSIW